MKFQTFDFLAPGFIQLLIRRTLLPRACFCKCERVNHESTPIHTNGGNRSEPRITQRGSAATEHEDQPQMTQMDADWEKPSAL